MKKNKCPQCLKNYSSGIDPEYGILKCEECLKIDAQIQKPTKKSTYEFASTVTKEQRKTHGSEMVQPYIDGVLSREYLEINGTRGLANVTEQDKKKAKYVYKGMTRHHKIMEDGKRRADKRYNQKQKDTYIVKEELDKPD